jgi:hypothetical protein
MRLKAEVWIAALTRRVFADGGYAAIERRGAGEAGAIFIRARFRNGTETLFAPAPQAFFDTGKPEDRLFEPRLEAVEASEIEALLARESKFDPDFWVVEIETDDPERYLTVARG